jgi:hypothetical protein
MGQGPDVNKTGQGLTNGLEHETAFKRDRVEIQVAVVQVDELPVPRAPHPEGAIDIPAYSSAHVVGEFAGFEGIPGG